MRYTKKVSNTLLGVLKKFDVASLNTKDVQIGRFSVKGYAIDFASEEARQNFQAQMLENQHPVQREDGRMIAHDCWWYFSMYRDWSFVDHTRTDLAGADFRGLPTVEFMNKSAALFIAESQLPYLCACPWICLWRQPGMDVEYYLTPHQIDELVIIPDAGLRVARPRIAYAM